MRTNFFQAIQRLHSTGVWIFNVSFSTENEVVVSVVVKDGGNIDDKNTLPPMVYRGTPQEIDEGIFDALVHPIEETKNLFANLTAYNKGLEDAKAKIMVKPKIEKSADKKGATESIHESTEDRPKFEDILSEINKLNAGCKYSEALALLPVVESFPEKKAEIEKLRKELEWKSKQLTLL